MRWVIAEAESGAGVLAGVVRVDLVEPVEDGGELVLRGCPRPVSLTETWTARVAGASAATVTRARRAR